MNFEFHAFDGEFIDVEVMHGRTLVGEFTLTKDEWENFKTILQGGEEAKATIKEYFDD